jgi:DNA (cytosine-5)-methyltransferase 1
MGMRSLELFSGCGGLALGTARAGFEHVRMVEWNADACATLALNKRNQVEHARDWPFIQGDVRAMSWGDIDGALDLVAGGPPCQPFSIGGKHAGNEDARDMWPEAIRAVREVRPRAFLFENVKGLLRPAFAEYLEWITTYLAVPTLGKWADETHAEHLCRLRDYKTRADYDVRVLKVNAADYGAPQKRHRVVVAGVRRDLGVTLPLFAPTHSREALLWDQWVTGDYWKRHRMASPAGGPATDADLRLVARMRAGGQRPAEKAWVTVRDAIRGLGVPNGKNGHVFQGGARVYVGHTGSPLDEPAKALKAGDHGVPGGENMMVRDDGSVRYFTIREAARLQGLPDDWSFATSGTESMRQLGNAVPTQLAEALGRWMAGALSSPTGAAKRAA